MDIHLKIILSACLLVFLLLGIAGSLLDAAIWHRNELAQTIVTACSYGVAACFAVMFATVFLWLWST